MTIEELQALSRKVNEVRVKRCAMENGARDVYKRKWQTVAPRLVKICGCILPGTTIAVSPPVGKYAVTALLDGGCRIELECGHTVVVYKDSVQFSEKDNKFSTTIYKAGEMCDPCLAIERYSPSLIYLIKHWETLEKMFIEEIAKSLNAWGVG